MAGQHSALVVGTGFGCRIQVPALRAAGFDVVGLVGENIDRTRQRAELNDVPRAFIDLDQAIAETGATVVAIATPPHTHHALVLTAARHRCHIICEKPFAVDATEATEMLAAAERAGIVHLIGHEFRWLPAWATLARVVADGSIGVPRFATFTSFTPTLTDPNAEMPEWWFDRQAGGGWLGAQGSHLLDWVRSVLGEVVSLSGVLPTIGMRRDGAEDSYLLRFRTEGGAEGVLQQTTAAWGPPINIMRIAGDAGTVWIDGGEVFLADAEGVRALPAADDLRLPPIPTLGRDPRFTTPKWQMLVPVELPLYIRLCKTFHALIEDRGPQGVAPPSFADGLACMRLLDAVRQSADGDGACVSLSR